MSNMINGFNVPHLQFFLCDLWLKGLLKLKCSFYQFEGGS